MKKYSISFETGEEFALRLEIFSAKDDEIELHNSGNSTYTLGHNAFSHLTWEEFRAHFGLNKPMPPRPKATHIHKIRGSNPPSVDHTAQGLVTPVKNQGQVRHFPAFISLYSFVSNIHSFKFGFAF